MPGRKPIGVTATSQLHELATKKGVRVDFKVHCAPPPPPPPFLLLFLSRRTFSSSPSSSPHPSCSFWSRLTSSSSTR